MTGGSRGREQAGVTYLAMLFFVAATAATLAATGIIWSHERQRQKELELLWIGEQFREAIGLYYQRSPGVIKRYPEKLEDLIEDRRHLTLQRYLRRIYRDPITGQPEWGLVPAPGGGIMGVHSLSELAPIKSGNFPPALKAGSGGRYADWRFLYEPPVVPAKAAAGKPL